MYALFDFCGSNGENLIVRWARKEALSKRDRTLLDVKIDLLAIHGTELIPKLLAPVEHHPGIFKLRVQTNRALRPMLCKGTINMDSEFTFLLGSVEENFKLRPPASHAMINKVALVADKSRRISHERFG